MPDFMAFFASGAPLRVRDAADKADATRKAKAAYAEAPVRVEAVPYPFCHDPRKCAGLGYCPKEIACND